MPIISAANLPPEILAALKQILPQATFTSIIPNAKIVIATRQKVATLPQGYQVVLTFAEQPASAEPPQHEDGDIYALN